MKEMLVLLVLSKFWILDRFLGIQRITLSNLEMVILAPPIKVERGQVWC